MGHRRFPVRELFTGRRHEALGPRPATQTQSAAWESKKLSVFECERDNFQKAKPATGLDGGQMEVRRTKEETKVPSQWAALNNSVLGTGHRHKV